MATLQSETAFDYRAFNLNFYHANQFDWKFSNNVNVQFGSKVYADMLRINGTTAARDSILTFLGPEITVNSSQQMTGKTITAIAEHAFATNKGYGISGFSIAATAFETAMSTVSVSDDAALLARIFAANDIVSLSSGRDVFRGFAGSDLIKGNAGSDVLAGDAGNDNVYGGSGNDRLTGGLGNDILIGGRGADVLNGGAGSDKFLFNAPAEGTDIITGFTRDDFIVLKAQGFGGVPKGFLNPDIYVIGTTANARDADDRFIFRTTDDTLWFDSNGNRSGGLTKIADLNISFNLSIADILII